MSTRTRYEKEAKGNSEMAYFPVSTQSKMLLWLFVLRDRDRVLLSV